MAKGAREIIKNITLLLIGILIASCANQLPPGGGDVDKAPPEIIEVYPADGTTNFNDEYFELGFSEYVDKRSLKDAIFISPALDGQLELDWSGKYVRVYFPSDLRENTTYVITIGTDLVDYNNKNRLASAFTLTFSTGNEIDRRVVAGKVYDPKPEGILIFAFKANTENLPIMIGAEPDSAAKKPDYISQTGGDGSYKLGGLAAGTYRIFAVRDEYRDLIFQSIQDEIGVPYKDITLSESDTLYAGLNFFLSDADTSAPRLSSAVMTDRHHILVNLSEEFDSTLLVSNNFSLYDSTTNRRSDIKFAYKGNTKPTEFVLVTSDSISLENSVFLFSDSLRDNIGNTYFLDYVFITASDRADTSAPSIIKSVPAAGNDRADFINQDFYFQLSDAVDSTTAKTGISFTDTSGNRVNYLVNFIDDASFIITPSAKLDTKTDYMIKFDFSKFIDASGKSLDSVYQYKFRTITGLEFTGISGTLTGVDAAGNTMLTLENIDEPVYTYKQKIKQGGEFKFERVQPGKYRMLAFLDRDSSGTYNYGWPYPFIPSEEFSVYPDTLNLRPRWTQTDLLFEFK